MNEQLLQQLMALPSETEWLEFKKAENQENFDDIGKYFAAISNEANFAREKCGWLIFGVTDKLPRTVCGTNYRRQPPGLESLKKEISETTNHQMTFSAIFELEIDGRRVLAFQIPPAPRGVPTEWRQVPYGRIHESLGYLTAETALELESVLGLPASFSLNREQAYRLALSVQAQLKQQEADCEIAKEFPCAAMANFA